MNNTNATTLSSLPTHSSESVSIVFDGWNVLLGAATGFGYSRRELATFTLDLPRLADKIVERRRRSSHVERIAVVMGIHDPRINPAAHAAETAVLRQWKRDPRVTVIDPGMDPVCERRWTTGWSSPCSVTARRTETPESNECSPNGPTTARPMPRSSSAQMPTICPR